MAIGEGRVGVGVSLRCRMRRVVVALYCSRSRRRRIAVMLNGIGLRGVVGVVGVIGGGRREGLGEWEGGILTLYILGMIPCRIDVVCMADRGLPSTGCAGGVGIWVRSRWVVRPSSTISGTVESVVGGGRDDGVWLDVLASLVRTLCGTAGGRHGSMEGCELLHHLFVKIWLVCVYGLGMLAEIVEAGELLRAVTLEGAFAGMLSDGGCE